MGRNLPFFSHNCGTWASVDEAREAAKGKQPYEWRVNAVLAGYEFARLYRRTEDLLNEQKLPEAEAAYAELDRFYGDQYPEGDVFNKGEARSRLPDGTLRVPGALGPLRNKLVKAGALQKELKNPRLAEMLDTGWRFQIDPNGEGMARGWQQADAADEDWAKIDTCSPWQQQGFPDFYGTAWYRRCFALPKIEGNRRVILAFDAVDGDATVWLNGEQIGTHELLDLEGNNRWDTPFTFDITGKLKPEGNNVLVVRVKKNDGNGGIHRPVRLLWADANK